MSLERGRLLLLDMSVRLETDAPIRLANDAPIVGTLLPSFANLSIRAATGPGKGTHTHHSLRLSILGTSVGAASSRDDADDDQPRKGGMPKLTVREPAQLIDPADFDPMASGFGYSSLRDNLWEVIYVFEAMAPSKDGDESETADAAARTRVTYPASPPHLPLPTRSTSLRCPPHYFSEFSPSNSLLRVFPSLEKSKK